jgi:predicted XRE-type DNA-binding protein
MTIDTKVRHVTKAGSNIFADLGFEGEEAETLKVQVDQEINEILSIKTQLMEALAHWIEENELKQSEAAQILMVSRPRVSDVVNKKTSKFTIDTLIGMLGRTGKHVRLAIA